MTENITIEDILRVSIVNVKKLCDEALPQLFISIGSTNYKRVDYFFKNDLTETKHTPPLNFSFFNRSVMFAFDQGGGNNSKRLTDWLLPKAEVILVSLGGQINDQTYLREEMEGRVKLLNWVLDLVQRANKPTLYILNGVLNELQLTTLHKEVNIPDDAPIVMYNRDDPASLEQLLKKLFAMSPK